MRNVNAQAGDKAAQSCLSADFRHHRRQSSDIRTLGNTFWAKCPSHTEQESILF
ncbi:hypothetical protein [Nostoc sp. NMS4]|uniref:hypothetical protein n=1 Tax=Nostoc sp. NMS4 TaxID=2815390 RepID=UPI0025EFBFF1|nr:hypothetical protein [Nostoc sp. NMS4]MBN3922393.1 hypothetical protein [Nostoc sp. NMS4]